MDKATAEQVLAGLHPELVLTGLTLENLRLIKYLLAKEDALDDCPFEWGPSGEPPFEPLRWVEGIGWVDTDERYR